jgi:DNA-binding NarL/FixJ family response regulator
MHRPLLPHSVDRAPLLPDGSPPSPNFAAEPVSVVICDEHRLFADAFSAALRQQGADVLATTDPDDARRLALTHSPWSVVLNVHRTPVPAVHALRAIRRHRPGTRVICLVGDDPDAGRLWLDAGADLVLSKRQPLQELVDCVLMAGPAPGAATHGPGQRSRNGAGVVGARGSNAAPLAARFLTDREREVLRLLVAAESTKAIARRLGISVPTARRHIQSTFTKLGVHSRVEAVTFAVRHAIVEL